MTALSIPLLSLLAGVSFYAGVHHLFIGLRRRVLGTDIMFAVMALAIAGVDITMLLMYHAADLGEYLVALKWHSVLHAAAMVALLWIVACYSDYRPSRLLAGLTAITLAVVVGVLMHPYGMLFASEPELTRSQLPWGEQVWTVVGPLHPHFKLAPRS